MNRLETGGRLYQDSEPLQPIKADIPRLVGSLHESAVDPVALHASTWISVKNHEIWKPKIEERRENTMENGFTPVEASQPYIAAQESTMAIPPVVVNKSRQVEPVLMPYQSVVDVEPVQPTKPERLKKAERLGAPTRKERHALRDLAAGRQVEPKVEAERLQQLLEHRMQQGPISIQEGLQAIDATKQQVVGEVIVDFTR